MPTIDNVKTHNQPTKHRHRQTNKQAVKHADKQTSILCVLLRLFCESRRWLVCLCSSHEQSQRRHDTNCLVLVLNVIVNCAVNHKPPSNCKLPSTKPASNWGRSMRVCILCDLKGGERLSPPQKHQNNKTDTGRHTDTQRHKQ